MQSLLKDVTYAWRTLRSNPAFSLTAIITLALGIGASTAVFSVVNSVLLRPLPYGDADRLTLIWGDMLKRDVKDFPFPPGDLPDLRQQGTLFQEMGGVGTFKQPLVGDGGEPEQVNVAGVTWRALAVSGAIAGIGGLNYVLGYKHYYEEGFATGAGFLGIAVALVGRSHPMGIGLAALLFATLSQGGLAVNALVPKQMVDVLQAVVILAVATSVPEVRQLLRGARRTGAPGSAER